MSWKIILSNISIMIAILVAFTISYAMLLVELDDWIYRKKLKRPHEVILILGYFSFLCSGFYIWNIITN